MVDKTFEGDALTNRMETRVHAGLLVMITAIATLWFAATLSYAQPKSPQAAAPAESGPNSTGPIPAIPEPGETFRDCPDCSEMVVVPEGEFKMGSSDTDIEKPEHRVVIANPFAIGRREVSFAEWDACVAAGGCKYVPGDHGWGRANRPVIDVSWDDAKAFVTWLARKTEKKYRLPSEAEWEYAARAGTTSPFWWGRPPGPNHANCEECGGSPLHQTTVTGSFRPNGFGLYDVAGNAAEWVEDCWNENYRGAPTDGSAWTTAQCGQRVLRGGSFASKANFVRSASRFHYDQDVRYYANGFRVARDLP